MKKRPNTKAVKGGLPVKIASIIAMDKKMTVA
jgi:hypothetical protein